MLALCFLPFFISSCTRTESWSEEVALRDGERCVSGQKAER